MPSFGTNSLQKLSQAHPDLQRLFKEVVKTYDCAIICGHRGKEDQDKAFREKKSKLQFPNSKHNSLPSMAVDVVPYFSEEPHIRWDDTKSFYDFAAHVFEVAKELGITNLRWGGDWDGDKDFSDQKFNDLPHFELT